MRRRLDLALALVHEPADPVPRRADHRPRRPEPHRALGRGRSGSRPTKGSPSSSPPSTSRRPTRSPTGSGSSTPARSSPRARRTRSRPRSAGRPSRPRPADDADRERDARGARPLRPRGAGRRRARVAVRLDEGTDELADGRPRARRRGHLKVANLEIHAPTLDDVFLAKTGRRLEGAGDDAEASRADGRAEAVPA